MNIITTITQHVVMSGDLNHHGTLYAGRTAEWFVESGFIAAASLTKPENIVCLKIHGMLFSRPVHLGEIVCFRSRIVSAGRTSMIAFIETMVKEDVVISGFITFIHADAQGHPIPHGLIIEAVTDEEKALVERAESLPV